VERRTASATYSAVITRLDRVTQYAAAFDYIIRALEYWVARLNRAMTLLSVGDFTLPYSNIPDSSSSACSISASLTTTSRRGTRNSIVEAQAIESTTMAMLSGTGVAK
jgi:hypothetical protein